MDEGMLIVYTSINFKLVKACSICSHRCFRKGKAWGVCKKNEYEHSKYGDRSRLRIHTAGVCSGFELDLGINLGEYGEHLLDNSKRIEAIAALKRLKRKMR